MNTQEEMLGRRLAGETQVPELVPKIPEREGGSVDRAWGGGRRGGGWTWRRGEGRGRGGGREGGWTEAEVSWAHAHLPGSFTIHQLLTSLKG